MTEKGKGEEREGSTGHADGAGEKGTGVAGGMVCQGTPAGEPTYPLVMYSLTMSVSRATSTR